MELPPGPRFLLRLLPAIVIPCVTVVGLLRLIEIETGTSVPIWAFALGVLAIHPALFIFRRAYSRYAEARAAAASNAFMPPHVVEQWPYYGGLTIMRTLVNDLKNGYPGDGFLRWMEEYGPTYQLRMLSDNRLLTAEPEHIKQILATQFDSYEKGPATNDQFGSLLGTGVFNSDGEMWKFHRSMTRPFFTKDRISHFDMFDSHAENALSQAKIRIQDGYPIDFQDLVSRFTLDSATQFLFGHDVESLSAGLPYPESSPLANSLAFRNHPSNVFVDAFLKGQDLTALRGRMGPTWPLAEFWGDKVKPLRKTMDKFTEPVLVEALRKRNLNPDAKMDDDDDSTLLSHLIQHTQDVTVLKDELLNLLVAGRDTTACTLTFALYMLCEHPKIAERLYKEIIDVVGPTDRPTYENIRDMKYLRAFLNEVLRLYPAVPFDSRTSNKPTVLDTKTPGSVPIYVPANTKVIYAIMLMHRRKDLWGPDALEFDPDRFLDQRLHKYLTPNPFIFSPFNAGPRICLGQQFAYQESSFFLVRLLQQFRNFRMAPDAQPEWSKPPAHWAAEGGRKAIEKVVPGTHLTMYARGGLWVRMDEQKSELSG
ncbi:cytochrome P450 monooxygenase pc-3 [Pholiota conissans]|uniref:Cytochrome P450 monooxygenase pc-3 n=1 Tax=Pholiota conissans TaxID=109636 RepID=A0A9P5YVI4_9AGAR|nr:cytochrome P450 monooxygenase pc-3 [Pholiota conissans]